MNQEIFVIKGVLSLRGLPGFLAKRQYNVIRHGIIDKNDNFLVGLSDNIGGMISKSGLICIRRQDFSMMDSVVKIAEGCARGTVRVINATAMPGSATYDRRRDFISLLAENEALLPEHAAMAVTCTQLGISEDEGYDLLQPPVEAIVERRVA